MSLSEICFQNASAYELNFREENTIDLPEQGKYGTGIIFMAEDSAESSRTKFSELAESLGLSVLAWREPPRDNTCLGEDHVSRKYSYQ